jgi:molybdopterin-containing oxidoreductase family membrane subunit
MHINFFTALKSLKQGGKLYFSWLIFLSILIANGISHYIEQLDKGLIVTAMRDPVSWGFYISNFTFLVGVAAAAVLLVIPAYIYHFKPIKEIVLFGEMLAITAIIMCLMFITADMGKPLSAWHIFPIIGKMNFPSSLLAWDVIVLNGYLVLNLTAVLYILHMSAQHKEYNMNVLFPIVLLSIPWAVSIHTVTAFLYNGLSSRPFWNASILAPRFIASAMCSGPALMLIIFQIIRKFSKIQISDTAIFKIAELIAYAMTLNLFLFGAEVFKEFYSNSVHLAPMKYMYFGLHGHNNLVFWMWLASIFNICAFLLFAYPKTRGNYTFLNLACVMVIVGVYIEKGMGLVIPGFIPSTLGEIYEYSPSITEKSIGIGIWAFGALFYTLFVKFAIPIYAHHITFDEQNSNNK